MQYTQFHWFAWKWLGGWAPKPVTTQGWVFVAAYGLILIWDFIRIDTAASDAFDTLVAFAPDFLIITLVFLLFVLALTGPSDTKEAEAEHTDRTTPWTPS